MSILTVPLGAAYVAGRLSGKKSLQKSTSNNHQVFQPTQGLPKRYQQLSDANPYANVNYRQSWIQKLLSGLGFRTNYDAYLEGMNLQAQEYDNQVLQKQLDEEYNSPLQQALREQAAGLNPNLTGNVSSGEASPIQDDGNPPVPPVADDLQVVQSFASGVLNAVQAAFGLYGNIQSVKQLKINNESSMMNLVKSAWSMIIPDIYENRNDLESGRIDINNYYNSLKKHFGNTMSKKQFDSFVNRVNSFANSAEGWKMVYDTQTSKAKARKSMFQEISDPDSYSEWDDVMSTVGDVMGSLAFDVQKRSLQNDKYYQENVRPEELQNKEFYEEALDPTVRAKLDSNPDELSITHNQKEMSDYQNKLRDSFRTLMNKLDSLESKGNKVAPIVKAVLSVWLMGMMPSISVSRTAGKFGMSTSASIK